MNNFKNLYEITKTLRFELKPSKTTKSVLLKRSIKNEFQLLDKEDVAGFFEKIKNITKTYNDEFQKINRIWEILENDDKTKIFAVADFFEKLYKYSFIKKGVSEPKIGKKVQMITFAKSINDYLDNFKRGNLKSLQSELLELQNIISNYENGKGKENREIPKKVEIYQHIRKIVSIYLKTREILSHLEKDAVLHNELNRGISVYFLPELKEKLEEFFLSNQAEKSADKYLKTLSSERGLNIGIFSLNKYAVNNFKEISILEEKISEMKEKYDNLKAQKFNCLQERETAYWKEWKKLVENNSEYKMLKTQCPEKSFLKKKYKELNKEVKNKIYNEKIQKEVDAYKKTSNEFGNIEKEYISLQRELEEVSESKYFGRIIKESENKYYLALANRLDESDKKKSLGELDILNKYISNNGDCEMLDFYKFTFSAFEKLCLLQESTLGLNNFEDNNIKKLWKLIRYKRFNINSYTESNIQKITHYFEKIIQKHSNLFPMNFDFEKLKNTRNFKEFEKEFNRQGYKLSKQKISKEKLLELEKNSEILLFQIFCKDFVFDKNFALTDFDKTKIGFESKGKDNLHTRYIKEFFQNIENKSFWSNWRLFGEGKLFFREGDEAPDTSQRYKDDKFFLSLGFQIYPNTLDVKKEIKCDSKFQEKHIQEINKKIKNFNSQYVIGLDQGVNSLVSYCVIDRDGNIVKDKNGKYEIGDLSLVISSECDQQGEFVEVEDTLIVGSDKGVWNEEIDILELKKENNRILKSDKNIKVFDYAEAIYAESYSRQQEIVKYKEGDKIELEKITDLKKGYASHIVHKIEQLAQKYSPAIISLEYMQDTKVNSNFVTKKTRQGKSINEILDDKKDKGYKDPKRYRFGTSTVEAIEDALLRKFGYWNGKVNQSGEQFVPDIIKKSDLYEKNIQWGNIVFIDETETSVVCPKCEKGGVRCKNPLDKEKWKRAEFQSDELVNIIYGQFRKIKERVQHKPENKCTWNSANTDREFLEIRNGDDLAAYNIAKRGLKFIKSKKR